MQQTDEVPADVHRRGLEALNEELGPVEMINFLHYYNSGSVITPVTGTNGLER